MAEVKVGYSQGAKVSSPADRYENASFNVNFGLTFDFEELPEDPDDVPAYKEALLSRMKESVDLLRSQVEEELQRDIDEFKNMNGG